MSRECVILMLLLEKYFNYASRYMSNFSFSQCIKWLMTEMLKIISEVMSLLERRQHKSCFCCYCYNSAAFHFFSCSFQIETMEWPMACVNIFQILKILQFSKPAVPHFKDILCVLLATWKSYQQLVLFMKSQEQFYLLQWKGKFYHFVKWYRANYFLI